MQKLRIGDILLRSGDITEEQLEQALAYRSEHGVPVGKALTTLGYISESDLYSALSKQTGVRLIDIHAFENQLDLDLIGSLPESLIKTYKVIPLTLKNNTLALAVSDPLGSDYYDQIRALKRWNIKLFLARESAIDEIIENLFPDTTAEDYEEMGREIANQVQVTEDLEEIDPNLTDSAVQDLINGIFRAAVKEKASDIHIEVRGPHMVVRFRIHGTLYDKKPYYDRKLIRPIVAAIKNRAKMDTTNRFIPHDGRFSFLVDEKKYDARISTLPAAGDYEKTVIRILDKSILDLSLEQLGFSPYNLSRYNELIYKSQGIILITGPTGSGKSSTLYATIQKLNETSVNIITVEDPVEYEVDGITQVSVNPDAGLDFAGALRSILRQDPNIILVGESRDKETADIAITAANTGHLVFTTLHTNSAVESVTRLVAMGIEPYKVADAVLGALSQRLVRRLCSLCKKKYTSTHENTPERELFGIPKHERFILYKPVGCKQCKEGFNGRVAVHEFLVMNREMRASILKGINTDELRELALSSGMMSLSMDGKEKVLQGITTFKEVLNVANH